MLWFIIRFQKCKCSDLDYLYCESCPLISTSILTIMLTLTISHNPHTPLPLSNPIPVILLCHLYVKQKTIVGNIVYSNNSHSLE